MRTRVAVKVLRAVETSQSSSNQHEFNGVRSLEELLGKPSGKQGIATDFIRLEDDAPALVDSGTLTWYDARENIPNRSELRLYYPSNEVTETFCEGDVVLLLQSDGLPLKCVVVPARSEVARQLLWLVGIDSSIDRSFSVIDETELSERISRRLIDTLADNLALLGLSPRSGVLSNEEAIALLEKHGGMPPTRVMSQLALARTSARALEVPDDAIQALMSTEEAIFRGLERIRFAPEVSRSATLGLDALLALSLKVLNARKSRAGHALQLHFAWILDKHAIPYTAQGRTEGKKKPDFLIPSEAAYHDLSRESSRLAMVATKTTCKDRWRQVVTEADRIPRKHLLTLEPAISPTQLDEMFSHGVLLVVPAALHRSFALEDQGRLRSISMLLDELNAAAH